jgi:hypothetical protein
MKPVSCLLLGAGASFASDFTLPTMSAFFREEDLRNRHELSRLLKRLFPTLEVNQYNLEEVLGFLDLSRARTARWGIGNVEDQALLDVLSHDLLEYVRERLAIPTNGVCNRHLKLFQQLGAGFSAYLELRSDR